MAKLDPITRHAITPPEFDSRKLHRERLVDRLHAETPRSLIAIAAPAGYGKSSLLADFAAHTELPTCWVTLSATDEDFVRMAAVLVASLEKRFRRLRGTFKIANLAGSTPAGFAKTLSAAILQEIPEAFVIVLDDIHLIGHSEDSMAFLDSLVLDLPDHVTIIVAGREVPEISLAQLMAEGRLAGLGPQDLALTLEEACELSQIVTGSRVAEEQMVSVLDETRGWITGVILSEFSTSRVTLSAGLTEQLAYEYLASVVLNRQPESIRRFLLDVCVLPIMTVELCEPFLSGGDAEKLLSEVSSKGLFITSSGGVTGTFEFHPMFRTLLLDTLKASAPDRFDASSRLAASLIADTQPEAAILIFLKLGEVKQAASIAEGRATEYFEQGRYSTLEHWVDLLKPHAEFTPTLLLLHARIALDRGDSRLAKELLEVIQSEELFPIEVRDLALIYKGMALLSLGETEGVEDVLAETRGMTLDRNGIAISERLHARHAAMVRRDLDAALAHAETAVNILRDHANRNLLVGALQEQTWLFAEAGKNADAANAAAEALSILEEIGSPARMAFALNDLAVFDHWAGRFQGALERFQNGLSYAALAANPLREAMLMYGQADIFNDLSLLLQAAELYEMSLQISARLQNRELTRYGCYATSILHRRSGNYALAGQWLARARENEDPRSQSLHDIQAASIIQISDPKGAIRLLEQLVSTNSNLTPTEVALAELFLAVALLRIGEDRLAVDHMQKCLDIGGLHDQIQFIAAEISSGSGIRTWLVEKLSDHPTTKVVEARIDLMARTRAFYESEGSDTTSQRALVRLFALGSARLIVSGESIEDIKPQSLELLVHLADNGKVDRDTLSEEFWPRFRPGRQAANLHMAIYGIRRALGKDSIRLDGSTYSLSEDLDWSFDVAVFENAARIVGGLAPGDPRRLFALTDALNAYGGPFCPEFYTDWAVSRRRQLESKFLDVAAEHADEAMLRNQPLRAIQALREALQIDPYRDDLNRRYMLALERLERRSDVIRHYEDYSRRLRDEFDLEPAGSVREIYVRVTQSS
jgi:ATP/maltotriose-dependent transcriptional regulator MalT/DNA-binding SARP family transcriptional activator